MATPISTSRPQWVRNVPLTPKDGKLGFPAPEKSLDVASGYNGTKFSDRYPSIFIGVYARCDHTSEQIWVTVYKWDIVKDTENTQWMKYSKYMGSQYSSTDWMEAKEEYCNEDGHLDKEMIIKTWLAEDEKGRG